MALILENTNQVEFHSDLNNLISPFKEKFKSLNWLVAEQDYLILDSSDSKFTNKINLDSDFFQFDGHELLDILEGHNIQFNWGIFCGMTNRLNYIREEDLPFADGNSRIWSHPDEFFYSNSEIEIICFDSSLTVLKFRDHKIEESWRRVFTDAKKLEK
ncbi:hypothetical protein [Sediminitomix flava]|uniref:Uncharacterized protein n=1 Tax=Sediminitomix flava TaxID=379075 RepID=A0A315YV33_SEDFL|nr:hypothetical protein [Sediminitomix flava]PWJ33503.1 hypothetical protein BC781_1135 [Sediminitomix flava]